MMMEDYNRDINNSLKEIQENPGKQVEALKKHKNPLKNYRKHINTGERIEQNHSQSKNGSRNNTEITKEDNPGNRKSRKEDRSYRYKHHQKNTRDRRENIRCRRYHRKH